MVGDHERGRLTTYIGAFGEQVGRHVSLVTGDSDEQWCSRHLVLGGVHFRAVLDKQLHVRQRLSPYRAVEWSGWESTTSRSEGLPQGTKAHEASVTSFFLSRVHLGAGTKKLGQKRLVSVRAHDGNVQRETA